MTLRYAYIKNGDVVDQVRRLGINPELAPEGGPDAFVGDFLKLVFRKKALLISRGSYNGSIKLDSIVAATLLGGSSSFLKNKIQTMGVFFKTVYLILKFRPNRILCGTVGIMLWAAFICSYILRIPLVQSRHSRVDMQNPTLIKRCLLAIDNYIVRKHTCAVIAHGPFLKEQLVGIGVDESKIFEFDVGYKNFHKINSVATSKYFIYPDEYKYVLYVGRIYREKGVFDLLDAMRDILSSMSIRLLYIGDGDDLEELKSRSESYGFNDGEVQFLGKLMHKEVGALMRLSHVVVAPTRHAWEGRCMSVMESLVMGTPVIAPDSGPFPYLIKNAENGLLYQTDSISDMSNKIRFIIENNKVYEYISNGAIITGRDLLVPKTRFLTAVKAAFECSNAHK